jgi:Carboxypeptidase regulatory-like domain
MRAIGPLLAGLLLCASQPVPAQTGGVSASEIAGQVIEADSGRPISGARVKLSREPDGAWYTFTDDAGHFRFSGLTGAGYSLAAQQVGFMGLHDGPLSPTGIARESVQPGQPVRIALIRYAVIAGTVTDASGAPVPNCLVNVMRKVPLDANLPGRTDLRLPDGTSRLEGVAHALTDQRGAYRVARLGPGAYYVAALAHPFALDGQTSPRETYYGGTLDFGTATPIAAVAGRTVSSANIQLIDQAGVRISGQIVQPTSGDSIASSDDVRTLVGLEPLPAAGTSGMLLATVKGDRFEIKNVLPGKYTLNAVTMERSGRPEARRELAAAIQIVDVGQMDLSAGAVALQPPHDLSGMVRFDPKCGPSSAHLSARSWLGSGTSDVDANADGSFVLNLLPSRYWLFATIRGDEYATLAAVRLGGWESPNGFAMLGEDYGPLVVDIVCPRGTISGRVVDPTGKPATSAHVALASPLRPGYEKSVPVDGAGRFAMTTRPGIWDVFACSVMDSDPRHSSACQKAPEPLTVKDGTSSSVDLTLPVPPPKGGSR